MKKGFSLIEIVQTLVLIGIIAGISVSLFKRIDNDEKLLIATEKQLITAIEEVKKRTCADVSPICADGRLCPTSNKFRDCEQTGTICSYLNQKTENDTSSTATDGTKVDGTNPKSEYNPNTGYCEYTPAAANCLNNFNFEWRNGQKVCFAVPMCYSPAVAATATEAARLERYTSVEIRSSVFCQNNEPLLSIQNTNTENSYEFCYQLHSIINHKNQGGVGDEDNTDLGNTCILPKGTCLLSGDCTDVDEEANMILPNGVRIYNLPCALPHPDSFCDAAHSGAIYVRYDRMDDLKMVDMNKVARYTIDAGTSTINGINYITNVSLRERECFNTTTKVWVACP